MATVLQLVLGLGDDKNLQSLADVVDDADAAEEEAVRKRVNEEETKKRQKEEEEAGVEKLGGR